MDTVCNFAVETDEETSDDSISDEVKLKLDQQYYKSLDGFLIVIAKNGDVVYVSENVEKYLGLTQVCHKMITITICSDTCPLSCVSAEAYKLAQCTRPQGWGS